MDETLRHLEALRAPGGEPSVAMATLVGTRGTTPKKEGAKMWIGGGGRILGSVTIGGCVDARVVAEAEAVLLDGEPRLVSMTLGDEDAWEMGLTCGGAVDVLVERIDFTGRSAALDAYDAVARELAGGRAAVIASAFEGGGGARLVVRADGGMLSSLGDPALDDAVRARAIELLRAGDGSRAATLTVNGRAVDVFLELHAPPLTMLIVGATHLAMPLARLASDVGLRTVVVDARERFATAERFPMADELRVGIPSELVAAQPLGPATLVVLVAHDYKIELPVLRVVLRSRAAYVGVLGSRRRGAALREMLAPELAPDELARIHLPIGLDIGARTVPEIALSVLAEAMAVARGRPGGSLRQMAAP
jgi:xanthine dehydrogenase accessory factor